MSGITARLEADMGAVAGELVFEDAAPVAIEFMIDEASASASGGSAFTCEWKAARHQRGSLNWPAVSEIADREAGDITRAGEV